MTKGCLLSFASVAPASLDFPDSWCGHWPFAVWLMQTLDPRIFVEVGTADGNSYFAFCHSVKIASLSTKCYAVGAWANDEFFARLSCENQANYAKFSHLLRIPLGNAALHFSAQSVDLLHLIGFRDYEAVKHAFEAWLPILRPGAVVLCHNIAVRQADFDVWKFWQELQARYPYNQAFTHANGLGILQIPDAKDRTALSWLEGCSSEWEVLSGYFSALGTRQLERLQLAEARAALVTIEQTLADRQVEVANCQQALLDLEAQLARLKEAAALRDESNATLRDERDCAVRNYADIRRSRSWRLTAPLRFVGHIMQGDFATTANVVRSVLARLMLALPLSLRNALAGKLSGAGSFGDVFTNSRANHAAIAAIVDERCDFSRAPPLCDPLCARLPADPPVIDVCVVTFNSSRWVRAFVESLLALDYPKARLSVRFIDNSSTDSTLAELQAARLGLEAAGCTVALAVRPNRGFGAGQNEAIRSGSAPFCLVTNVDLAFQPDALRRVVATAVADVPHAAAWELRQMPYEHPKFYDPVTGTTNWNSHACVLLRRMPIEAVGGYDESLFMYGEDVELSYRLREAGYLLRYCPAAAVFHYSYDFELQIKPLQYTGSTFANLYLRMRYGHWLDVLAVPWLGLRLVGGKEAFPGSRRSVLRNLSRLTRCAPVLLARRCTGTAHFPFRGWDYDLIREGAFQPAGVSHAAPLVSVITRTCRGRSLYLRQAMLSVAHQTFPRIEHIIVEDGGESQRAVVEAIAALTHRPATFLGLAKVGRSAAGNAGLSAASGRWCLFLDDDDLLFADHIDLLSSALSQNPRAVAAYAMAWDVITDSTRLDEGQYAEISHAVPSTMRQSFDRSVLLHHNFMAIQSVLFERHLFLERGGFDEDMEALEDWVLWLRYSEGNEFFYVPKVTSMFRTPADPEKVHQRMAAFDAAYPLALARANQRVKCAATSVHTPGSAPQHAELLG